MTKAEKRGAASEEFNASPSMGKLVKIGHVLCERDVPTRTLIRSFSGVGRLCAPIIDRDKGVDRGADR